LSPPDIELILQSICNCIQETQTPNVKEIALGAFQFSYFYFSS
jgi:hypothetical protein